MELVIAPDERLKTPCKAVLTVTEEYKQLARDMYVFMKEHKGIGLAANQVGECINLIVVDKDGKPLYMFNPRIIRGEKPACNTEGCLSFPGEEKICRRHQKISVKYDDINGTPAFGVFEGLVARCIQHEVDHLRGVTFDEREKK